jgi:hypothetical protein
MTSFGSAPSSSLGSTTLLFEEPPTVIHNLQAPDAMKTIDDASIVDEVSADLEADHDISESHYYGGDIYYPTLVQDYYSTAKLSVNVVRVGAGTQKISLFVFCIF